MIDRIRQSLKPYYQSLIFRILLYFVVAALTVAIVLGWNFANRIKPHFENELLPNLSQYIQYLVRDIGSPPDLETARHLSSQLPLEIRIEGPNVSWSSSALLKPIDHYRFHTAPPPYRQYQITRQRGKHLLLLEQAGFRYVFAIESDFRNGSRYRHGFLFVLLTGILVLLYLAIRRLFRPLSDISSHLKKIGAGQLDESLKVKGRGEIAELAKGINQMSLEIKSMLEAKASLLLAISHELRSPITRMRINLELLDETPERQALIDDLQEMEELVSGILESERLNHRHAALNLTQFELSDCIEQVIEQQFATSGIVKDLDIVQMDLDEVRIRLLVKNLIGNACRYSADSLEPVEVSLKCDADFASFIVKDHGPGVDTNEIVKLTEPFYRTDGARLRKTGGYGLGLYLCRLIVEAHQGELEIHSQLGQGMTVIVKLPLRS